MKNIKRTYILIDDKIYIKVNNHLIRTKVINTKHI